MKFANLHSIQQHACDARLRLCYKVFTNSFHSSRSRIGKESADKKPSQATSLTDISASKSDHETSLQPTSSSRIGYRLHYMYERENSVDYSCCTNLSVKGTQDRVKLKQWPKMFRRGSKRTKDKRPNILGSFQVGKCESTTSLDSNASSRYDNSNPDAGTGEQSSFRMEKAEENTQSHQSGGRGYDKFMKHHSAPTSPRYDTDDSKGSRLATSGLKGGAGVTASFSKTKQMSDNEKVACRQFELDQPKGICLDDNDNILVVDKHKNRLVVFTSEGHFVRYLLTEIDGLKDPIAVCILEPGKIAVTDSSSCIKVFEFYNELW